DPGAETSPFRAWRSADHHGRLCLVGAEHALRERPWRYPSRGCAQTAVETTVGLDGEATAQPGGPTNRQPGTARPGSRAQARAPCSEGPGLHSGRCLRRYKSYPADTDLIPVWWLGGRTRRRPILAARAIARGRRDAPSAASGPPRP